MAANSDTSPSPSSANSLSPPSDLPKPAAVYATNDSSLLGNLLGDLVTKNYSQQLINSYLYQQGGSFIGLESIANMQI